MTSNIFFTWNIADIISISLSIILFLAGAWVAKNINTSQEKTLQEIHDLQEATSELQIREKIGVISGKINAIEITRVNNNNKAELIRFAMNIWQDGLSVLPLFRFASEKIQIEYRDTLAHALLIFRRNPNYHFQLERMYSEIGEQISRLEERNLECSSILRGAISFVEQEKRTTKLNN